MVNMKIHVAAAVEEAGAEYEIKLSYVQIKFFISSIFEECSEYIFI